MTGGPAVVVERDIEIAMRDGVRLRADVYRPQGQGRWPVLLGRTCYGKESWGAWIEPVRTAAEGYAVVINDTRGGFGSEGEFKPFFHDIADGYDVIEWCGVQPWSTGRVGMFGSSAPGFVQLLAAMGRPPHLVAIAPMQTWSSFARGCVYDPGGAFLVSTLRWALHQASIDPGRRLDAGRPGFTERRQAALRAMWELGRWSLHRPLTELPALPPEVSGYFHEWLAHPDQDEFWWPLDVEDRYGAIEVPALHLVGWFDKFALGSARNYRGLAAGAGSERARRGQRIVFGPWPHGLPVRSATGHGHFGPAGEVDVRDLVLQWYDHWLKGKDTELFRRPPVRIFVLGENAWRWEEDWPPPGARFTEWFLHSGGRAGGGAAGGPGSDGRLSCEPPGSEPCDAYVYDPADPAPSLTLRLEELGPPPDPRVVERRPDVLFFATPALAEEVEVTGPVRVRLWASTSAPDTDWVARLCDLGSEGSVRALSEGMVRARYRRSQREPAPAPPGEACEYEIELVPVSNLFRVGHRIRLEITSSAAPLYHPNLNTGGGYEEAGAGTRATQVVYHDRERPSRAVLPIVSRPPGWRNARDEGSAT
jgi:putative CocE/NonD family hydrolase